MAKPCPYSYVTTGGVENARVRNTQEDATIDNLRAAFYMPLELDVTSIEYHNSTKKQRGQIKRQLPYFVGGTIEGRRHDSNVTARTMLTLDIESNSDDGPFPPEPQEVLAKLKALGGAGWIYTSVSHTPKAPRYRIVLPLGKPLEGDSLTTDNLKASTLNAARRLGVAEWCAPESWVLSQAMYLPAKLKGGVFWEGYSDGSYWKTVAPLDSDTDGSKQPADIPEERPDPVLLALMKAGLYLRENPKHPGMHFITCPFIDQHEAENDTQTVYYEAHYDGNPRPAVKCFDTAPDEDGRPHLTYAILVRWLTDEGYLDAATDTGVLEDYDSFLKRANLGALLDSEPTERQFAIRDFAPIGKVTVLAGPGGVSKSMLLLTTAIYGAVGLQFGPFHVDRPLRTLVVSYEDDRLELHKRMLALARGLREQDDGLTDMLYDIEGSMRKNLLMFPADEEVGKWLLMGKPDRYSPPTQTDRVEWLAGFVKENDIKLLILDPVVYTHTLEESDPGEMALYMQMLNGLAKRGECAIVLIHHMHKTAMWATIDEVNQGSLRGASSFADNARSVGVMVSMPTKDAPAYGLPAEHTTTEQYAVFKHVKHNYSSGLGVTVFQRKGAMLIPRPDITKMGEAEIKEAREQAKEKAANDVTERNAYRILAWLADDNDGATLTMVNAGSGVRMGSLKKYVAWCEEANLLSTEPGPNRSVSCHLTKEGRAWIKRYAKEHPQMLQK